MTHILYYATFGIVVGLLLFYAMPKSIQGE